MNSIEMRKRFFPVKEILSSNQAKLKKFTKPGETFLSSTVITDDDEKKMNTKKAEESAEAGQSQAASKTSLKRKKLFNSNPLKRITDLVKERRTETDNQVRLKRSLVNANITNMVEKKIENALKSFRREIDKKIRGWCTL